MFSGTSAILNDPVLSTPQVSWPVPHGTSKYWSPYGHISGYRGYFCGFQCLVPVVVMNSLHVFEGLESVDC